MHKLRPLSLAVQEQRRKFPRAHVSRKQNIGLGAIVEDLDRPPCRLVALDPVTELEPCRIESARHLAGGDPCRLIAPRLERDQLVMRIGPGETGRASWRDRECQYV